MADYIRFVMISIVLILLIDFFLELYLILCTNLLFFCVMHSLHTQHCMKPLLLIFPQKNKEHETFVFEGVFKKQVRGQN